ncbi:MAG: isochorismatase family protein [Candidatus Heimdallarchaeota archaeon]|nr:isochorismatase family protein [Candidatus Heimdallarchaeota archaeon]
MLTPKLLNRDDTILFVIDPQGSLMEMVKNSKRIIHAHNKIIKIAQILSVPIVVSEHYPKGLGHISPEIVEVLGDDYKPIEKVIFSAWGEPNIRQAIESHNRKTLLIIGIETHICILQTVTEAIAAGYDVHVMMDAVSARGKFEHKMALEMFKLLGAGLTTWESVAYQWIRTSQAPEFKQVLEVIKDN